ncbi:O-methyltransferase [Bathymodiolus thermophilus thioautotrophic gill symbiont]|uniref:16S rRNA (Cytosine(1402)-N(4))-methyltransferase n=1 Tax=Bathymodiolus thermophilus thioautotrophic gill symbiont TaxID=2360 RepID=A0A1J5TY63_9GAMM|nr:class I SAM-dependent methyltransferase [Bathymodiolus thermophilus thioautotrophic gill symbiont]OIR25744.1 16S rRNA (cytosine(1402)-N(4))-methyltransferase [Bathymodiolus thermophilus thioautotrophic gill symbiont]
MINNKKVKKPLALDAIIQDTQKINFNMTSENDVGALLRTLAATKNNGCSFLELGTGTGMSTSWILDGMSNTDTLITMDNDQTLLDIANKYLGHDERLTLVCEEGDEFIQRIYKEQKKFDFIFADTWSGKYQLLAQTLDMLNIGGLYIIDDMKEQENWPEGHELKVKELLEVLNSRIDLSVINMDWSCGVLLCTKIDKGS